MENSQRISVVMENSQRISMVMSPSTILGLGIQALMAMLGRLNGQATLALDEEIAGK